MPSLLDQLCSPAWWITAVVFGTAVNLLSAYLKKPLDTALGKLSNAWATRSAALRAECAMRIMFMRHSADNRILASVDILHLRIWTVLFVQVIVGIGVGGATGLISFQAEESRLVWGFVAMLMLFNALHALVDAAGRDRELREAVLGRTGDGAAAPDATAGKASAGG